MHGMVCSVCYVGCMVVLLNEESLNVTTFRYRCLGNSLWHGTHYLFIDTHSGYPDIDDAVTTTFHVLVNTYFLHFRLALLIVLRALLHLIYLVIFDNFLVFNFPFLNFEQ